MFRDFDLSWSSLVPIMTPFLVLAGIALLYFIVVLVKRSKERKEFKKFLDESSKDPGKAVQAIEPEDESDSDEESAEYELDEDLPEEVASSPPSPVDEVRAVTKQSWKERLALGLGKTRNTISTNLSSLFMQKISLTEQLLEKVHEVLYKADIGVSTVDKLIAHLKASSPPSSSVGWEDVKKTLKSQAEQILSRSKKDLDFPEEPPFVVLVVGVNGVGKTTTIGKLAAYYLAQDQSVLLCAADTFRAAAIEQLQVWGDRLGVEVIKQKQGSDPAAVAFDAVKAAKARKADVLFIDTAGRLHNKDDLMAELGRIKRAISKEVPSAPHEIWLVLDATTGQNAVMQVKAFREVVNVTGLIVTKLDGTAKGGVLLGITDQFNVPIRFIGVGEKITDLRPFDERDYVESIFA